MNLILIEWIDSASGRGWRSLDEIEKHGFAIKCRTVGWLVKKTKDVTVVASSVYAPGQDSIEQCGCGDMAIPNVCIQRVSVLRREK